MDIEDRFEKFHVISKSTDANQFAIQEFRFQANCDAYCQKSPKECQFFFQVEKSCVLAKLQNKTGVRGLPRMSDMPMFLPKDLSKFP